MINIEQSYALLDAMTSPIVFCDKEHIILFMNKSAIKRYKKFGGEKLIGKSLLNCHNPNSNKMIEEHLKRLEQGEDEIYISTDKENRKTYMIAVRGKDKLLLGYFEEHR